MDDQVGDGSAGCSGRAELVEHGDVCTPFLEHAASIIVPGRQSTPIALGDCENAGDPSQDDEGDGREDRSAHEYLATDSAHHAISQIRMSEAPGNATRAMTATLFVSNPRGQQLLKDLPIAVVAYNREMYLRRCLTSLLSVRGVKRSSITVYQDGFEASTSQAATSMGVAIKHHVRKELKESAAYIADHYKFVLSDVFADESVQKVKEKENSCPQHDLIVVMKKDATVYCVSAYNDNGFETLALDSSQVYRTEWFIGLGWLALREIVTHEWLPHWPETHWDHWLREDEQRKGRECLFPEPTEAERPAGSHPDGIARIDIVMLVNGSEVSPESLLLGNYEEMLGNMLAASHVVRNLKELDLITEYQSCSQPWVVYYEGGLSNHTLNSQGHITSSTPWKPISNFFGLWHEPRRGIHRGLHRFHFRNKCVLLVDAFSVYARNHMPREYVTSPCFPQSD
ncbi:hypothetical protein GUITHDRAFT_106107 [Guillardia theta CCMP2712]|uniref:Uncharacterized protein n=1 Tax=Guillardia theta (strain CCMP2712) TaxID=905079 RepID=L1JHM2_GUITC|nr:hypothetical protein GUITHDRAFT_106107 [Guillardia theta CCMP2712]EKX48023.1 hypothetical protein GUITHDRAFT_106107 [Guillardia theta CCMP2712]|eukprot:XP_005835003.1 hypothetical protein GUITHDRAFT_106107 [Guillardia theta CCMP2712]